MMEEKQPQEIQTPERPREENQEETEPPREGTTQEEDTQP